MSKKIKIKFESIENQFAKFIIGSYKFDKIKLIESIAKKD